MKQKMREYGLFDKSRIIVFSVFVVSLLIYITARFNSSFAEFFARYPSTVLRIISGKLTSFIPFSLAEAVIICSPIIIIAYLAHSNRIIKKGTDAQYYKSLVSLISLILLLVSFFFTSFGVCYFRKGLDENLGIERTPVTPQELYDTVMILTDEMKALVDDVTFIDGGRSLMPYSYKVLVGKLNDAYKKCASKYDFITSFKSNVKPVAFSEELTYTHISGVYSFFTGESNVNTNFPDYIMPYTIAHEMSHQRGIAREDEANFMAFLVCLESDDSYIKYSAYLEMADYIHDALSGADSDLFAKAYRSLPQYVKNEYTSFSEFYAKYRNSTASKVTGTVNNTFLQSQGQTKGTKSYGMVVDLTVAYYKQR